MARHDFRFQRGEYVKDIITGLTGVVVSRMDSITRCDSYCVQPTKLEDGKMMDAVWLDDMCLEYDPENLDKKVDLDFRHEPPPG